MKLTILPSDKGDCMLLESVDGTSVLIDGGMSDSYVQHVRPFLARWKKRTKRKLDLVYLSHIDQDHISGILKLMDDLVDWRVFRHKTDAGEEWDKPESAEPPEVARIWHNSFRDQVGENAGEIGSMLAARAAQLTNSGNLALQKIGAAYQAIAASIPEAIRLSGRVSAKQLNIPLNKEFGGLLAMVRDPPEVIRLNGAASPSIKVLGPFAEDLDELKKKWNAWLRDKKNKNNLARTRSWRDEEDARFNFSNVAALAIDDELGDRGKVTEENLASLMLMVEQGGQSILLTGDGHHEDIIHGLTRNELLADGAGLHVNVLKIQHHGSEHNLDRDFARRITADHYVICGNGRHENPDLRVLEVLAESRIGPDDKRSSNPEAERPCKFWFNCSVKFLREQIKALKKEGRSTTEYEAAADHFSEIEKMMKKYAAESDKKLKLHFLTARPLELDLG